jgi:energy-converting hydrogenase Eha subunit H
MQTIEVGINAVENDHRISGDLNGGMVPLILHYSIFFNASLILAISGPLPAPS